MIIPLDKEKAFDKNLVPSHDKSSGKPLDSRDLPWIYYNLLQAHSKYQIH